MAGTKVGDIFVRLGLELDDFSKGLADAKKSLKDAGRELTEIGTSLSMAFTAPLAGVLAYSVNATAGYEKAMNRVEGLLRDFSNNSPQYLSTFKNELIDLDKLAIKLGIDTQYSALEAAQAMGELAQAGFGADQLMKGMAGTLSLASVGAMKLADAAQIAASVVGGFGIAAGDLSRVADVLAKASSISAASVQDLGYSFKYIGPVAKAAGITLNETAAALAILANAGIRGEQGGTGIRNMLSDLLKPSAQAEKVLSQLKITLTDVHGKMLPLADIVDQFNAKQITLTQGFQIWGMRFSEVLPLLQAGGDKLREFTREMEKSEGSAQKMADTFRKGISGMWENFKGTLETLGISIGRVLEPAILPAIKWMTELGNKAIDLAAEFSKLDGTTQAVVGGLFAIPAAIGPILVAMGLLAQVASSVIGGLGLTVTAVKSMIDWARAAPAALATFGNALLQSLTLPLGQLPTLLGTGSVALLALGQAALGAAAAFAGWQLGKWLYDNVPALRAFGDAVADLLLKIPGVEAAINRLSGVTGMQKDAQEALAFTAQKMAASLKAHGIVVDQGTMSLEQYVAKMREMAKSYYTARDAASAYFSDAGSALTKIGQIQQQIANLVSKATIGVTDKGQAKAMVIELDQAMKGILATQNKINEAVKAGKIDKTDQVKMERQLADAMSQAKSTMTGLNEAAGLATRKWGEYADVKKKVKESEDAAKKASEAALNFHLKVQDVLEDLPRTYAAYAKSTAKLVDVPKELEPQFRQLEQLKEKLNDLRREIEKAPDQAKARMWGDYMTTWFRTQEMDTWFQHLVNQRKVMDQAVKDLEGLGQGFDKVSVSALKMSPVLQQITDSARDLGEAVKPVYTLEEAYAHFRLTSVDSLQKAADKARELNEVMQASNAPLSQKLMTLKQTLEAQIELDKVLGNSYTQQEAELMRVNAQLEAMGFNIRNSKKEMSDFARAWEAGWSRVFDDFGKGVTDAILAGKNFGEVMAQVLKDMGENILRFTLDILNGTLAKGLKDVVMGTGTLSNAFSKLFDQIGKFFGLTGGATAASATGDIAKQVSGATQSFTNSLKGMVGVLNLVVAGIDAVFGALSYFQGRRMETDIGRIEVTTREIKAMLGNLISEAVKIKEYASHIDWIADVLSAVTACLSQLEQMNAKLDALKIVVNVAGASSGAASTTAANQVTPLLFADQFYDKTLKISEDAVTRLAKEMEELGDTSDVVDDSMQKLTKSLMGNVQSGLRAEATLGDLSSATSDAAEAASNTAQALNDISAASSDYSWSVAEASQEVTYASLMMTGAIDLMGASMKQLANEVITPASAAITGAFALQDAATARAMNWTPSPGSPGGVYMAPLAKNQAGSFQINVYADTSDGRAVAGEIITTLRSRGVDI